MHVFFCSLPIITGFCLLTIRLVLAQSLLAAFCPDRTLESILPSTYPYREELEVKVMTIIWGGSLAVLLNKLKNSLYKVEKIDISFENTIKRYGVYCFCIDDLPL